MAVAGFTNAIEGCEIVDSYGPRAPLRFWQRPETMDIYVIKENKKGGQYLRLISSRPTDVRLDIGGHIGSFSCAVAQVCRQVYTMEPVWQNYNLLLENIELNGVKNVIASPYAVVGNNDRKRDIFLNGGKNTGGHSFLIKKGRKAQPTTCININALLTSLDPRPNMIKMDIEGGELEILRAIEDWSTIDGITMEFHFNILKDNTHEIYMEIIDLLKAKLGHVSYNPYVSLKSWHTTFAASRREN